MKLNRIYSIMALSAAFALTGCIEETFPESSTATEEQVTGSASGLDGAINGISAQMSQGYLVYGEQETEIDMGMPALMIAQTQLLGDIYPGSPDNTGYDWYGCYNDMTRMGPTTNWSFIPWFTLYKFVKSANDVISIVDIDNPETPASSITSAGIAYACRAYEYYLLTVLYEPVENIYTDCSKVLGLTVPFVLDTTTPDEAKNNPRATHDEMIAFILSDLDKAETCLKANPSTNRLAPTLAAVYGIRAKVHLLDGDYANAAKYARLAIDESGATPMTADEMEDPTSGFSKATSAWIWYLHYSAEQMGNLCNYVGWMSGEADWGYSSLYQPCIDRSLYDHMSATDARKHLFLDPDKTDFYNYKTSRDDDFIDEAPSYLALKFRCLNGDFETYSIGGASDVPVLRVEELYLIEAEAVGASQGVAAGVQKLNSFMQTYRDEEYNYTGSDLRAFQIEVLTQMRIEAWGEGWAFPSAKRLKPGVVQNYEGTNAPTNDYMLNCQDIKPNWTLVIPNSEVQSNVALEGKNNPDPTSCVKTPVPVGQYAPANF